MIQDCISNIYQYTAFSSFKLSRSYAPPILNRSNVEMTACSGRAFSSPAASLPVSNPRPLSSFFASAAAATCRESLGADRENHLAPLRALIARSPPVVPREEFKLLFFERNKLETRPGLGATRTTADASISNRYMYQNRALLVTDRDVYECQTRQIQRY